MTNRKMLNSTSYKTYLAFTTRAATPKKARKFKKPYSRSKKKTLIVVEEPAEKPAKKLVARRQSASVQIRDTPGVSMSKKKAPAKAKRSKGIELLSEVALLKEAQLKKAIKRSKRETDIHQAGGSSKGVDLESDVPDEPKGKSINTNSDDDDDDDDDDDQQGDDERTKSDNDKVVNLNEIDDEEEDSFVHTSDDYIPTDDENIDDEEYDHINEEMYNDANMVLKDAELEGKGKDDEKITNARHLPQLHRRLKFHYKRSSILSDYATKFLNFDNIPLDDTEIISMMEIQVQHENPSYQTSPLLTIPVLVILKSLTTPTTTISPPVPPFIPLPQQSTLIPTPTTTYSTILAPAVPNSINLMAVHQGLSDLEKEVKILKDINHQSVILAAIKSEVPYAIKECLGTNLGDTLKKKRALFETMTKTKSFNKNTKHKSLYHAIMESILKDENAMDKGVADRLKKRNPNDADKDEGPPTEPDQGLKRKKMNKKTKLSKKAKSNGTSKGTTKSHPKSTGKSS
nr:hypothetical protein [Tanacetum cinerariifolium]